jgi:hypothetical protein
MAMEYQPNLRDVGKLIEQAEQGALGLPEFQRNFIWRPPAVADLLRTVARNWPAGSFLLLEGPQDFACKSLEGAPPLGTATLLILDGQQRMTGLYQALRDQAQEMYYVEMTKVLEVGDLEDEHIKFESKASFTKKYHSTQEMAAAGIVTVSMLADDNDFFHWVNFMPENQRDNFIALRSEKLSGFKSYAFPCVVLPKQLPISALAKIFETINRTGMRLDAFDLMVAKLYPSGFRLRDQWEQARSDYELLVDFEVDGIEILKTIALIEHLRQVGSGAHVSVKGVRQSDVLELKPATVKAEWGSAVEAYTGALKFLRTTCGVINPQLLPSKAMVLPLACALRRDGSQRAAYEKDVERWFWTASFQQTYAQGANTQAVTDAKALRAWEQDLKAVPHDVATFTFDSEVLRDQRRRNEMFVRGLGCLLIKRGARDWLQHDVMLKDAKEALDLHHVFPKKHLESHGIQDADGVANFTPMLATTNKALRNESPTVVAKRHDISQTAVESHFIQWGLYSADDWDKFIKARSKRLQALVREVVGSQAGKEG